MASIVTMCDQCAKQQAEIFRVKVVSGTTTTEKKKKCEFCKNKLRPEFLKQYIVSGKGGK